MLREFQDRFIEELNLFDNWTDRFNYLIEKGEVLPAQCPEKLLPYRFEFCQSKTCFHAENNEGRIKICGWSNSAVMAGIIAIIHFIFDKVRIDELKDTDIDFHTQTGLIDNLTQFRRQSLEKMIAEIIFLKNI